MKKFFKKTEGFTLVELIVVIAILGILAGIGTVGYSGYIKKANEAADNQLLAALNTSFAAACIENGLDGKQVTAANITIPQNGVVGDSILAVTSPADKAAAIVDDFSNYFEGGTFKYYTSLTYDQAKGAFVGANANGLAQALKTFWDGSSFGKGQDGGQGVAEDFLKTFDQINGWLDAGLSLNVLLESAPESLVDSLGFTDMFGGFENMGVEHFASDAAGRTAQEVLDGANSLLTLLSQAYIGTPATDAQIVDYYKQTLSGNALDQFNANLSADYASAVVEATNGLGLSFGDLNLDGKQVATMMANAGDTKNNADISGLGGMYALAAGFYNSSYYNANTMGSKPSNYGEFAAVMNAASCDGSGEAFQKYLSEGQALQDMEAYVSFMSYLSTGDFSEGSYAVEGLAYMKEALGWS